MWDFPTFSDWYDRLANAFLAGQTYLLIDPHPALLLAADPYDSRWYDFWRLDAVLFNSRYYLYWGAVPAVLVAALKSLHLANYVPDEFITIGFTIGLLVFAGALIEGISRHCRPEKPIWPLLTGLALIGLATPLPHTVARPAVYEAAILGGQCFVLGGMYCAFVAYFQGSNRNRMLFLACCGILWALAAGTRISLAPAIAAMSVVTALFMVPRFGRRPVVGLSFAALPIGVPLLASAAAMGYYNFIRFGSPFETGFNFQLNSARLIPVKFPVMGTEYIWPNLWEYFFRPISRIPQFPFLKARFIQNLELPSFIERPVIYGFSDPVGGLAWVFPCLIFSIPAIWWAIRRTISVTQRVALAERTPDAQHAIWWLIVVALLLWIFGMIPDLLLWSLSMRYMMDFSIGAVFLSTLGICIALDSLEAHPLRRRAAIFVALATTLYALIIGFLLGVEGDYGLMRNYNPLLYEKFVDFFFWLQSL